MAKKESKPALAENKKRGQQMYVRLATFERATRWPTIVAHALSLMFKGEPDHQATKVAAAKAAKKKKAEPELVAIVPLVKADEAIIKTPSVPEPIQSSVPSGTYDHDYYHNIYRYPYHNAPKDDGKTVNPPTDNPFGETDERDPLFPRD